MNDFKFYIDVSDKDVKVEQRDDTYRIYFRNLGVINAVRKLIEDLKIYAKYHDR